MTEPRVPFLLGHAEIAALYAVERQTSQKWRTEGTLDEPDLIASGNPYWLLATAMRLNGVGERQVTPQRLAAYKASIPRGHNVDDRRSLPPVVGIKEAARIHNRDAQTISRWRNRRRFTEADLVLSGSPLWLLETVLEDARRHGRAVQHQMIDMLRAGHRDPQKPRGRRTASASPPPRKVLPATRTFSSTDGTAAADFLTDCLAEGHAVVIEPRPATS